MHARMSRCTLLVLVIAMFIGAVPYAQARAAYRPVSSIVLTVGSPTMVVNGFTFPVDVSDASVVPLVDARWNRAVVPVRSIVEMTGGDVTWSAGTRSVHLALDGHAVDLTVGTPTARVNGRAAWIDADHRVVPTIVRGHVMIPIRFAAESLGGLAVWTAASRTITLTLPKQMVEVTDMVGAKVTVPRRVIRIATVSSTATQLIFAVGAQDQLVAARFGPAVKGKAMAQIFPRMSQIPDPGDQNTASIETLLAARPDIVLTEAGSMLTALKAAGLPAYVFSAEQPGQLVDGITRMGQLTGHVQQAQKAVDLLNSRMKAVSDAVAGVSADQRPRVYVAGSGIFKTFGGDFFQTFMVRNAGGVSVSEGVSGGKIDVSPEQVLAWNPDVIILTSYTQDTVSSVLANPKLQHVAAVINKRVYVMPKYIVSWDMPVPESFLGTLWLARTLYPSQLHIDLATEIGAFYQQFYGFTVPAADVQALSQ